MYKERQTRLDDFCKAEKLDGFLVFDEINVRWLTGFLGSFGMYWQSGKQKVLVSDSRYKVVAQQKAADAKVHFSLFDKTFRERFGEQQRGKMGVDSSLRLSELTMLEKKFPNVEFIPQKTSLAQLRRQKDTEEIQLITHAQAHVDAILWPFLKEQLREGVTEKEVHYKLRHLLEGEGMYEMSFDPIIAFGEHSAIPHHTSWDRKLMKGDAVLVDCGVKYMGYCSDMTRNAYFGTPNERYRKTYDQLLKAQENAVKQCVAGVATKDIDTACRQELGDLNGYFTHSLGHGVGLDIHESPTLTDKSEEILLEGDVVTVEPGIYFDGDFGIRIEDLIVVQKNVPHVLSQTSKELLVLT